MNVSIEIGTLLGGKYRVEHELGRGGMGVVYAGKHEGLGRSVAIKVLVPEYAHDANAMRRFLVEARAAAQLDHPNVVDVLDVDIDEHSGSPYMVLELLKGESLASRLERGVLDWNECWTIMEPVLDALQAAHEAKIVHRDLKPDNIFLSRDGRGRLVPKVLDFGIAKLLQKRNEHSTQSGALLGTPFYMAPEQAIASKAIGPWTDVWSLAVVIYECLTGSYPFDFGEGIPFTAVLVQICSDQPQSLRDSSLSVPIHVAFAVDEALIRDHEKRINTARGFSYVLGPTGAAAFEDTEVLQAGRIREVFDSLQPEETEIDTIWPLNEFALIDEDQTRTDVDALVVDESPGSKASSVSPAVGAVSTLASTGSPRGTLVAILFALCFVGLAGVIGGALVASGDEPTSRPIEPDSTVVVGTSAIPAEPQAESVVQEPSMMLESAVPDAGMAEDAAVAEQASTTIRRRSVPPPSAMPAMHHPTPMQPVTMEAEAPTMLSRSGIIVGADEY